MQELYLWIASGPAALPVSNVCKVDSTSEGNVEVISSLKGGLTNVYGNVAFVSLKIVCLVKCLFQISAYSRSVN